MNIDGSPLKPCSLEPITGYSRTGYCDVNKHDRGKHLVCAKMDKRFLDFSESQNNNLRDVVKEGEQWCLCEDRFVEAQAAKKAPIVVRKATNARISKKTRKAISRRMFPKLKPSRNNKKKHHYRLKDGPRTRRLAIDEGIDYETKHTNRTRKQAAIAKKGRLNILRIYRKNSNPQHCNKITRDMRYIDKKYKLGKTTNVCKK